MNDTLYLLTKTYTNNKYGVPVATNVKFFANGIAYRVTSFSTQAETD